MHKKFLYLGAGLLIGCFILAACPPASAWADSKITTVMISEVQTTGLSDSSSAEDGRKEFIELYNSADTSQDITGWQLEYLSSNHAGSGPPTRTLVELEGTILPKSFALFSVEGYFAQADIFFGNGSTPASGLLAKSGGHVRLTDDSGTTIDLLTWGNGRTIQKWARVPEIPAGPSAQRILLDSDATSATESSFRIASPPTPQSGGWQPPEESVEPSCMNLVISEILPNPAGPDAGKEFIEIYNPTVEAVNMKGCSLRLSENGRSFALPDALLAANSYRAFSDVETGIILSNAAGQMIWLVSSHSETGVLYADGLDDNQAWAFIEGKWQTTLKATPGDVNTLQANETVIETPATEGVVLAAVSCAPGKERNPETGRCRNILAEEKSLTPCKIGQERNPLTLRCRSITPAASSINPCMPGQERNPATNRCRTVAQSPSSTKPCPAGQERNPQTNRCRKAPVSGQSTLAKVQDVQTEPTTAHVLRWWIAGLIVAGAIGYAVYEWRQDIASKFAALKQKVRLRRKDTIGTRKN